MRGGAERLGEYTYRWDETCFPLGPDSLALGEFCTLKKGDRVLDLGCGAGLLLLLCKRREPSVSLYGVEIEPQAARLARENLAENGLAGEIANADLGTAELPPAELVVSNPPWYDQRSGKEGGPGRMESCTISQLCAAAGRALAHRGRFAFVHDPKRLAELMTALRGEGLEPKRLQFCRHSPEKEPYAVLVEAVKGGRPGLAVLPDRLGNT